MSSADGLKARLLPSGGPSEGGGIVENAVDDLYPGRRERELPRKESRWQLLHRLFCKCTNSMRVPLAARWEMDPLAKWMRFNVFPRTLLLHLALLLTVTTQVVFVDLTVRA
jgi:hypothetical protein